MVEFTTNDILLLHEKVTESFADVKEGYNYGLVESVARRPSTVLYNGFKPFDDIYSKAASIMEGIIRWHVFTDGNKRTALCVAAAYLDLNGYSLIVPLDAIRYTVKIAKNKKDDPRSTKNLIDRITRWLLDHTASSSEEVIYHITKLTRIYKIMLFLARSIIGLPVFVIVAKRWLALDIYPEYGKNVDTMIDFIQHEVNKFATLRLEAELKAKKAKNKLIP